MFKTRKMPPRSKTVTQSTRAGLIFPVGRVGRYIRNRNRGQRTGAGAAVFLAAVLEYLCIQLPYRVVFTFLIKVPKCSKLQVKYVKDPERKELLQDTLSSVAEMMWILKGIVFNLFFSLSLSL